MVDRTQPHRQSTPGHVRKPTSLVYGTVSLRAQHLWEVLDDLARDAPSVIVSRDTIATTLGCSARTVRRLRTELVDAGWLAADVAGGRGHPIEWTPLRRARPVDNKRPPMSPFTRSQAATDVPLYGGALIGTARDEEKKRTGLSTRVDQSPGCARCDGHGWLEDHAGRAARCPCWPSRSPF